MGDEETHRFGDFKILIIIFEPIPPLHVPRCGEYALDVEFHIVSLRKNAFFGHPVCMRLRKELGLDRQPRILPAKTPSRATSILKASSRPPFHSIYSMWNSAPRFLSWQLQFHQAGPQW
jgi:hypothetical protein